MENYNNETIFGLESTELKFGRQSLSELSWEITKHSPKRILLIIVNEIN